MNIIAKIKKINYKTRYKKFKNCSIPYPFYDKKRDTFEWVTYYTNIQEYSVSSSLLDAIGNRTKNSMVYHFRVNLFKEEKKEKKTSHCHSFEEVVKKLYDYPESFEIPDEFLKEYSEQELLYLKQMKNYLLLIGLKDYRKSQEKEFLDKTWDEVSKKKKQSLKDKLFILQYQKKWEKLNEKENLKRCENLKALELSSYHQMYLKNDSIANALVNGEKKNLIYVQHSFSSSKLNEKYLLMNSKYDYIGMIQITSEKMIKFKDLQENMIDYKLEGFNDFEKYKNHLLKKFKEESQIYNETFTEDSLIKYVKLKVIKKL